MTVLQAMAQQEGFGVKGTIPTVCHNPGDLIYGPEAQEFGAIAVQGRFAVFPTDAVGWEAFRRWMSVPARFADGKLVGGYLGATIEQAINRFAPPSDSNQTDVYIRNVCDWCGITPQTILTKELLG